MSLAPPPTTDERDNLIKFLAQQRKDLSYVTYELSDEQSRLQPTAGDLSIAWLIGHLAFVEQGWIDYAAGKTSELSGDSYQLPPTVTVTELLKELEAAGKRSEETLPGLDLDSPVPVPDSMKVAFPDTEAWSLRWVLAHLIQEYARHLGHADIIRESIDGRTMYELKAMALGMYDTYLAMRDN